MSSFPEQINTSITAASEEYYGHRVSVSSVDVTGIALHDSVEFDLSKQMMSIRHHYKDVETKSVVIYYFIHSFIRLISKVKAM